MHGFEARLFVVYACTQERCCVCVTRTAVTAIGVQEDPSTIRQDPKRNSCIPQNTNVTKSLEYAPRGCARVTRLSSLFYPGSGSRTRMLHTGDMLMSELQNVVKRSAYLVGGITEKFCPYCRTLWEAERREKKNAEGAEGNVRGRKGSVRGRSYCQILHAKQPHASAARGKAMKRTTS